MGYTSHHTIVVTGWKDEAVNAAHAIATQLFTPPRTEGFTYPCLVSPIVEGWTNGYRSFFIAPDGSKEGWSTSDKGDAARAAFKLWCRNARAEHLWIDWVEVMFQDDELPDVVTDTPISARVLSGSSEEEDE